MNKDFSVQQQQDANDDSLIAVNILFSNELFAKVYGAPPHRITIYPTKNDKWWRLSFPRLQDAIQEASIMLDNFYKNK